MNPPVVRHVRVNCEVNHAFEVFTTKLDLWWPATHRRFVKSTLYLEAQKGGRFFEQSEEGKEVLLGEVLRCEPPHSISWTWYPGAITEPTLVEVSFTPENNGTLVEVVHSEGTSGLGKAWSNRAAIFSRSWNEVLSTYAAEANK